MCTMAHNRWALNGTATNDRLHSTPHDTAPDDQTQPAHRHSDVPHAAGTGLLLRGQDHPCPRAAHRGDALFLSRPRRFGKSLLLDTLKELFEGNEALFAGLYIHDSWDWSVRYPVVRLSFGSGDFTEPGQVEARLTEQLAAVERRAGLAADSAAAPGRFGDLLEALHRTTGQPVAVLVDEYDKPILDALEAPEVARANRDFLRGVHAVIKDRDAHVRFALLTGVSKFSQGQPVLRAQRPEGHHARPALLDRLRLPGSRGRLDMVLCFNGQVYLFEFKVVESTPTGAAMAQLKDRRYADKYRDQGAPVHLIAVEFSSEARNLASFAVERA